MNIINIITKKKNKEILTKEEINFFINGYLNNTIKDYQISSLLMAIVLNGMTIKETIDLTEAMINSGEVIKFNNIDKIIVDKHSTGGVGDKTTLILVPILASLNIPVAKMSGRSLGFTGGTIDKLESIKGFNTNISLEEFKKQVELINCAVIAATGNLVPADKALYALRDVTGTVNSIPLIASSIMSKKIASGADKIVIDLKVGNGALMTNIEDAKVLADYIVKIGNAFKKETICVLTNMDTPLGSNIGNALEVLECIDILNLNVENNLSELVISLATIMTSIGKDINEEKARKLVLDALKSKNAFIKFEEMIKQQGGDINSIELAPKVFSIRSVKEGYLNNIDALKIAKVVKSIGAGRNNKEENIDHGVGVSLSVKVGDYIKVNDEVAKVYLSTKDLLMRDILDCFTITDEETSQKPLIYEVIK